MRTVVLFVVASLCSLSVAAGSVIDIQSSPAEIRSSHAAMSVAMEDKQGIYKDLSAIERQAIVDQQQLIGQIIAGKESIDMLDPAQKVQLANALESINAVVTKAEDDRKVCERIKVIGSNRPQSVCMTVGQRRRLRENAQRDGLKSTN